MTAKNLITILARMIAIHEGAARNVEVGEVFADDWAAVFERGESGQTIEYVPGENFRAKAEQFYELWMIMHEMVE